MKFQELNLQGAFEVHLDPKNDDRGSFARAFCRDEFNLLSLSGDWSQVNISTSTLAGTIRGLHYQRAPHSEIKLIRAISGTVLDVLVDLRKGSATYGKHASVLLDAAVKNAVYIPRGFAHGFQTLSDNCELLYFHSDVYVPNSEAGLNPLDPSLGIEWPLSVSKISDRDLKLPNLKELNDL